jgi:uncharacterized protein YaeQ
MALKAIIHKAALNVSDLDNNLYGDHTLTVARHPSETEDRMMVRLLAYALNVPPENDQGTLEFGKDMWEPDEPALCQKDLTGLTVHEIELGQPEEKRLVRACGRSRKVTVFTYGSTAEAWWASVAEKLSRVRNLRVWMLPPAQVAELGTLADKSMDLQVTVQDGAWFVGQGQKTVEINPVLLFGA